jgi:lysophospholipase L1-like esterase
LAALGTAIIKTTVLCGSAATTNVLTMAQTVARTIVIGVEPFLSTSKHIRIANAGVNSTTSTQWAVTTADFGSTNTIKGYAPDATVIMLGINDARDSIAPSVLQANLATIIVAAQVSGDVVLATPPPSSGAPYTTFEPQYQAVYKALSATYNVPIVDIYGRFGGTWNTAFMFDALHPNNAGYWDMAEAVDALLRRVPVGGGGGGGGGGAPTGAAGGSLTGTYPNPGLVAFGTQPIGDNTVATATDAFVNNQLCSIAKFNPMADGTTDDSAVFTTAAATCPTIILTPGKNYAIGTNLTLASGIFALASPAGGSLTVKTGVTLTLNGTVLAPLAQVFVLQGTGAVVIGPNTSNVYVEWFGAKGDNTADDTTAIQNTINAVSNGTVRFAAKTYKTSSVLTITHSYENLIGAGFGVNIGAVGAGVGGSIISDTATTGDVIKLNGGGTGNCGTGGIFSNRIEFLHIIRVTAATAGTGVNTTNGCFVQINNVTSEDSLSNFYLAGSGNTLLQNDVAFYNTTTGSIAGIGFNVDCTAAANASTRIKYGSVIGRGITGIIGLSAHGILADLFVDDFETAVVGTGVNIAAVGCSGPACAEDIHLNHLVLDVNAVAGVTVSGITNGGSGNRPSALIHDAYINTNGSGGIGVDIESSAGVAVTDSVIQSTGAGGIGVKIAGGSANTVSGTKFDQTPFGLSITSTNNVLTNNVFEGSAASPSTTHIALGANANINMVTGNQLGGTATNGITLTSTSLGNVVYPNIIDPTAITNSVVSNGGKGNVVNGPGYSTPTVGTCGTLGANSTNSAGFITSTVTGSCVSVLTFDVTRMGASGVGTSCSISNSTTPANLMQQTGSTTTSVTFTGTTVTGDKLPYQCTGY